MKNTNGKTEDKHQRIIKAALKVFAKKGFYNSRVSEIAQEAAVADGTIYLYFKNKDDILISVFETEMVKMISSMKSELRKHDDPVEKVRVTSAILTGGRFALPLKITSSIDFPRRCLALISPMHQRIASTRFDFPGCRACRDRKTSSFWSPDRPRNHRSPRKRIQDSG